MVHSRNQPSNDETDLGVVCDMELDTLSPSMGDLISPNTNGNPTATRYAQQSDSSDLLFGVTGLTGDTQESIRVWLNAEAEECSTDEGNNNNYLSCSYLVEGSHVSCGLSQVMEADYQLCIELTDAAGNVDAAGIRSFSFSYLEPLHIDTDLEANVTLEEETTITLTDNRGGVVTFNEVFFNNDSEQSCISRYDDVDINSDFQQTSNPATIVVDISQLPHQQNTTLCLHVTDEFGFTTSEDVVFHVDRCASECAGQVCGSDLDACFDVFDAIQIIPTGQERELSDGDALTPTAPGELVLEIGRHEDTPDNITIDSCVALDENGEPLPVNDTKNLWEILWRYHHEEGAGGLVENDAFGEEAYTFYRNEPYDDLRANCTDGCALIYARPFSQKIIPFEGRLSVTCVGKEVIESTEKDFSLTQTFAYSQVPEGGDHCTTDDQCTAGMKNTFYAHNGNDAPENGDTYDTTCVADGSNSESRRCDSASMANTEKTCVLDGDTNRGLNICNPYPAHQRYLFVDGPTETPVQCETREDCGCENDDMECYCRVEFNECTNRFYDVYNGVFDNNEVAYDDVYCAKPHQYPAYTAQGLDKDHASGQLQTYFNDYTTTRCVSYPTDADGMWRIDLKPSDNGDSTQNTTCSADTECANSTCNVTVSIPQTNETPCSQNSDCPMSNYCVVEAGFCFDFYTDISHCSATGTPGKPLQDSCIFPLAKIELGSSEGEQSEATCGRPCDPNGDNPQCNSDWVDEGTCEQQGVSIQSIAPFPIGIGSTDA